MTLLFTILTMIGILILHELGHIYWAWFVNLKVYTMGISYRPVPHVFVGAEFTKNRIKRTLYYCGGPLSTLLCFIICGCADLLQHDFIINAFILSLIIESNPFFSDFVTLIILNKQQQQKLSPRFFIHDYNVLLQSYLFSPIWYVHFIIWGFYIYALHLIKSYFLTF